MSVEDGVVELEEVSVMKVEGRVSVEGSVGGGDVGHVPLVGVVGVVESEVLLSEKQVKT